MKLFSIIGNPILIIYCLQLDYWTKNGAYSLTLSLGSPPQKQQKMINQINPISLSSLLDYNPQKSNSSKTIHDVNFSQINTTNSTISCDLLSIITQKQPPIFIKEFCFIYINQSFHHPITIQNPISFSYSFPNISFSIIHQLHNKGLIEKLSYSFIPETEYFGKMYIGEDPLTNASNLNMASCTIDKKQPYWGCKINQVTIFFDTKNSSTSSYYLSYSVPDEVKFQASERLIIASNSFMKWLNYTLFDKFVEIDECTLFNLEEIQQFRCQCDVLEFFPTVIEIVVDNYSFKLEKTTLFLKQGRICHFQIVFNQKEEEKWIIGVLFLNQYISTFDYKEGKIFFYSPKPFTILYPIKNEHNNNSRNKTMIKLLSVFISLCSLISIVIIMKLLLIMIKKSETYP